MSDSERTTIKAYGLEKYHKLGQVYFGKTILTLIHNKKILQRITVSEHLYRVKCIGNRVAALTGKGTAIILSIDITNR